jgi:hypothetical protein
MCCVAGSLGGPAEPPFTVLRRASEGELDQPTRLVVVRVALPDHARASDPLIGRIRSDGRRLHMVDNDGTLTGELLGPDEMEVCRTEVTPHSMNVYCATLTRRR